MRKVYVAHPYGGKEENKKHVEEFIRKAANNYPDTLFLSPIHAMGYLYNDVGYEHGMRYCLELLGLRDELILCEGWEESKGCNMEKTFADEHAIPIKYVLTFLKMGEGA